MKRLKPTPRPLDFPTVCMLAPCTAEPFFYAPGTDATTATLWPWDKPLAADTFVIARPTPGRAWCLQHGIEAGRLAMETEKETRRVDRAKPREF